MTPQHPSLYRTISRSMLGRYAVYAANLLSVMALSRVFTPSEYGTVAAIAVFLTFFQMLAEGGLSPAIVNTRFLHPEDRNGLFSLTVAVGLLLSGTFASLTPVFSRFYGIASVRDVVPFVATSLFFLTASIVPNALLLRDQAFFRIATAGFLAEVLSTSLTIALSRFIPPLWALSSKPALSSAVLFLSYWHYSASTEFGRPRPGWKPTSIKPFLAFSSFQLGFNLVNYFSRNLDNILVGKSLGPTALGNYDKAYQLMRYPLMLLTFAMTPAIQPSIRRLASDPKKVEEIHRAFTLKLSLVGATAGLAMYTLAHWLILFALGKQWLNVAPVIRILAIAIPAQVVLSTSGSFFQAMDRPRLLFLTGVASGAVMVCAIVIGVAARDLIVLSWLLVLAFHVNFLQIYYYMYRRLFRASPFIFLRNMIPAAATVIGMAIHWVAYVGST